MNYFKCFYFFLLFLFVFFAGCKQDDYDYLEQYKKTKKFDGSVRKDSGTLDYLNYSNLINLKNGYPFFILRNNTPLFLDNPTDGFSVPRNFILLNFGDVVFPISDVISNDYFFCVKTISGVIGWVYSGNGISVDYHDELNLYNFSDKYYLKINRKTNRRVANTDMVV